MTSKKDNLIEITRSFTYKLNLGNYQSADFFASQKVECLESEAEKTSEALYRFCKDEVIKSVNDFKRFNRSGLSPEEFEILKEKIAGGEVMQIITWELLNEEQQEYFQDKKREANRAAYAARKNITPEESLAQRVASKQSQQLTKFPPK